MAEYTPTEAQVRQLYANSMDPAGFDRWLTEVRREAAAEALREAAVAVGTYDEGDVHLWARDADTWLMARAARIARGEGS